MCLEQSTMRVKVRQCRLVSGGEKVVVITSIFFENPVGGFLRLRMMKKKRVNFCLKMSGKKMIF